MLGHQGDRARGRATEDARYRGEAFVLLPSGDTRVARLLAWSPNRAVLEVAEAPAGSVVVYNMNYDDGWIADRGRVIRYDDKVAVQLDEAASPSTRLALAYRPPGLTIGLAIAALGLVAAAAACSVKTQRCRGLRGGTRRNQPDTVRP